MDYTSTLFLVSLPDVKSYLKITDTADDSRIGWIIEAISRELNEETDRTLVQTELTEYYDGDGTDRLFLHSYPVSAVASVYIDGDHGFTADTLEDSDSYFANTDIGCLVHNTGIWPRGHRNIKVTYTAGYTQASVPKDLKRATCDLVGLALQREGGGLWNTQSDTKGDVSRTFGTDPYPPHIQRVIDRYTRSD